jgi:hypothetical protein
MANSGRFNAFAADLLAALEGRRGKRIDVSVAKDGPPVLRRKAAVRNRTPEPEARLAVADAIRELA